MIFLTPYRTRLLSRMESNRLEKENQVVLKTIILMIQNQQVRLYSKHQNPKSKITIRNRIKRKKQWIIKTCLINITNEIRKMNSNLIITVIIMSHSMLSISQHLVQALSLTKVAGLKQVMAELENKLFRLMESKREKRSTVALERHQFKTGMKTKKQTWARNKSWEKEKFKTSNNNKMLRNQRKHRIMESLLRRRMIKRVIVLIKFSKEM